MYIHERKLFLQLLWKIQINQNQECEASSSPTCPTNVEMIDKWYQNYHINVKPQEVSLGTVFER